MKCKYLTCSDISIARSSDMDLLAAKINPPAVTVERTRALIAVASLQKVETRGILLFYPLETV